MNENLLCNCNWELLEVVFHHSVCSLEAVAETEFGMQDIYEGLTPWEGGAEAGSGGGRGQIAVSGCRAEASTAGSFAVFMAHQCCPSLGTNGWAFVPLSSTVV